MLRYFRKFAMLFRRRRFTSDLDEELAFHRAQVEQELMAANVGAEQARREARLRVGNEQRIQEQAHDVIGFSFESAWQDLRYAIRQLHRHPGFAVTSILILTLGMGASTAIFSAVNPVLFKTLPYPASSRLMMIWESRGGDSGIDVTFASFHGMSERSRSFEAMAVMKPWQPALTNAEQPERLEGQQVSAEYFRTLNVTPGLGRDFQASDDRSNGPNVVILSDGIWRRRFAKDPAIVGHDIKLDDRVFTVIGILPASFEDVLAPTAQVWAPLQYDSSLPPDGREWGHHLQMIGRLREGVTRPEAQSELNVILRTLGQIYKKGYDGSGGVPSGTLVHRLQDDVIREVKPALLAVLGAVMILLLIACVNVANLLLARGVQRHGEFAMRAALGAERKRLIRQLITESLLLAVIAGTCGIFVATFGIRTLVALSPLGLPRVDAIRFDGAVFLFSFGVTSVVGVAVGLIPALAVFRGDLNPGMRQASRRTAGGHEWTRRLLVVAEVALALVLLVGAGLLLHSLKRLFAVDPGFDAFHTITMQVQESGRRFENNEARQRFFQQALEAVRQVPGVTTAAFTSQLPLSGDFESYGMEFQALAMEGSEPGYRYAVTPDYFAAMQIPLRRGRLLTENDRAGAPVAVLLSESFARRKFPHQDPIGQRVRSGPDIGHPDKPWAVVVGVVGDVKQESLALNEPDAFYTTPAQWYWVDNVQSLVVRTKGDASGLAPAIRNAIWSVDKTLPIVRLATMESLLAASEAQRRFVLVLFEIFALAALALAATGIYGVLAGSVNERTREIGIRAALGASPRRILAQVFRQGLLLTGLGIVIGLFGAAAASQALASLLFGISRMDPLTYLGVVGLLLVISAIACWLPAYRAAKVDPAITLRAE